MPLSLELMPLEEKPPEAPPPKSMVVRYGYLRYIGEFASDLPGKVGCGTKLVVKTDRGTEIAEMLTTACSNGGCGKSITRDKMMAYIEASGGGDYPFFTNGRILRVATTQDLAEQSKMDEQRQKHINLARDLVAQHNLQMKIVEVEYLLGGERVLFYFTSESRVDFRALVRDLAHHFHTRIELRQVGARDEARISADYEKCGQHCCCKQFLKVLTPISMKAAKIQKATLDPAKISGRCGRLMCCLRYEDQTYDELRKKLPKRNTRVKTPKADAWVVDGQILTQLVLVQYDDGTREAIAMENILAFDQPRPQLPDGRTMQSPNDRPPQMMALGPRGPGGPRGGNGAPPAGPRQNGPRPMGGPGAPNAPRPQGGPGGPRPQGPRPQNVPPRVDGQQPGPQGAPPQGPQGNPPQQGPGRAPNFRGPRPPGRPQGPQNNPQRQGPRPQGPRPPQNQQNQQNFRPQPGRPAPAPEGDPLSQTGPTGGDLNLGNTESRTPHLALPDTGPQALTPPPSGPASDIPPTPMSSPAAPSSPEASVEPQAPSPSPTTPPDAAPPKEPPA